MKFLLPALCFITSLLSTESFILSSSDGSKVLYEIGPDIDRELAPASTFKIPLALMAFDQNLLSDSFSPVYEETNPRTWIQQSLVWFSEHLLNHLDPTLVREYLIAFNYGNQAYTPETPRSWIYGPLKITPRGQVQFLLKVLTGNVVLSDKTGVHFKPLFHLEDLSETSSLYGKTGYSDDPKDPVAWFVGWVEFAGQSYPFAYINTDLNSDLSDRINRVKTILKTTGRFHSDG